MGNFALRFDWRRIAAIANGYSYRDDRFAEQDRELQFEIGPSAQKRGHFTKPEFLKLCYWKSPRTKSRVAENPPEYIEEVTRVALSTQVERLRIEGLTLLRGVSWPTASVVLHFAHREPYPIIDYRALWSLGVAKPPPYTFDYWWEYTQFCRELATKCGVSMRTLDRALWQYSSENQRESP